jgi:Glycosyltransferase
MKILWLCNSKFSSDKIKTTGSWLQPLCEQLSHIEGNELYNITEYSGPKIIRDNFKNIQQWCVPQDKHAKNNHQIASDEFCKMVADIIEDIKPDIVHVWGTETIYPSIYNKGYIKYPSLLEIQGLLSSYYHFYYGGLTFLEILKCMRLKEIILPWRCLFFKRRVFKKRGLTEFESIKRFKNIAVQSNWTLEQLQNINADFNVYHSKIMLREAFYDAEPWKYKQTDAPVIFTTASGAIPYKGIQLALKALALIKKTYPKVTLHIAGDMHIGNLLQDGFSIYINSLIKKYSLENNVVLLGSINANQIVEELQSCNVCLIPSFVETYCLAFAESMIIGVPTVVSYAGAMPELANDKDEAIFYNSNDFISCSQRIIEIVTNKKLSQHLSVRCRERSMIENDISTVVSNQMTVYNKLLKKNDEVK